MRRLLAKLCGVDSYMRALRLTNEQMSNEIAQLARDKEELKASVSLLRENANDNYNERVKAEKDREQMSKTVIELENKLKQAEADNNTLSENCTKYQEAAQEMAGRLTALTRQFDQLGREKVDMAQKYNETLAKLTKHNCELNEKVNYYKAKANHKKRPVKKNAEA